MILPPQSHWPPPPRKSLQERTALTDLHLRHSSSTPRPSEQSDLHTIAVRRIEPIMTIIRPINNARDTVVLRHGCLPDKWSPHLFGLHFVTRGLTSRTYDLRRSGLISKSVHYSWMG